MNLKMPEVCLNLWSNWYIWCTPPPAQDIKNSQLNCSTRRQPINKLNLNPNRDNLYLSDEPKNVRRDPEFVKQSIYLMYLSSWQRIKNLQFNFSTRRQPIKKLTMDPNRYSLDLSDEPKNIRRGPELVKQLIYLMYLSSYTRHQKIAIELLHKETTY